MLVRCVGQFHPEKTCFLRKLELGKRKRKWGRLGMGEREEGKEGTEKEGKRERGEDKARERWYSPPRLRVVKDWLMARKFIITVTISVPIRELPDPI
jgi:hypothetical protein